MESQLPSRFSRCRNDVSSETFAIINLTQCRRNPRRTEGPRRKSEAQSSQRKRGTERGYFLFGISYRVVQYGSSEIFAKLHEKIRFVDFAASPALALSESLPGESPDGLGTTKTFPPGLSCPVRRRRCDGPHPFAPRQPERPERRAGPPNRRPAAGPAGQHHRRRRPRPPDRAELSPPAGG